MDERGGVDTGQEKGKHNFSSEVKVTDFLSWLRENDIQTEVRERSIFKPKEKLLLCHNGLFMKVNKANDIH